MKQSPKLDGSRLERQIAHYISSTPQYRAIKEHTHQRINTQRNIIRQFEAEKQGGWQEAHKSYQDKLVKANQDYESLQSNYHALETKVQEADTKNNLLHDQVEALNDCLGSAQKLQKQLREDLEKQNKEYSNLQEESRENYLAWKKSIDKLAEEQNIPPFLLLDSKGAIYYQSEKATEVLKAQRVRRTKAETIFDFSKQKQKVKINGVSVVAELNNVCHPTIIYLRKPVLGF